MRRRCAGAFTCALMLSLGCSSEASRLKPSSGPLPEGQAVRVGAELLSVATLTRIAEQQGIAPSAAASAAVSDALFAQSARESLPLGASRSLERAAVARAMLEQLARAAHSAGPPTAAELADVMRDRWADLDRPAGARTTHAVVLNDKPERDAAAKALAQKLADALDGVPNGDELVKTAKAFPAEGFTVKAEKLP
ncbi:MAG TPA: hypothetical protein VNG33_05680, partial [Polyangiaceae bacterium]|nr:hypothetical protein [Polyangiaceae bacterium]